METGFWNRVKKVLNWLPKSEHLKWNKTEQENIISPTLLKRGKKQPLNQKIQPTKPHKQTAKPKKPMHTYSQEKPQVKSGWGTATPATHQPTPFACPSTSTRSQLAHAGKGPQRGKDCLRSSGPKLSPQHKPGYGCQTSERQEAGINSSKCRTRDQRRLFIWHISNELGFVISNRSFYDIVS